MSHNTFGHLFRVTTWGESHGPAIGCVVDGCPPRLPLTEADIQPWLDRAAGPVASSPPSGRSPTQVRILSGVFEGLTTGTPIALMIDNVDQRSRDYSDIAAKFRPGHADLTYEPNTASATIAAAAGPRRARPRCASRPAPSRARCWARRAHPRRAGADRPHRIDRARWDWDEVDATRSSAPTRHGADLGGPIWAVRKAGSSTGAVIEVVAEGVPPGLARRSTASWTPTSPPR
jgi:chorismate synthase